MVWTVRDLMLLKDAGVEIDDETLASVLPFENLHRDFVPCSGCGARSWQQHHPSCPRASILFDDNWYDIMWQRELEC
jgi:hypothetical protein